MIECNKFNSLAWPSLEKVEVSKNNKLNDEGRGKPEEWQMTWWKQMRIHQYVDALL